MIAKSFRRFSLLASLKDLEKASEKEFSLTSQSFITSYTQFIQKNSEDIYCNSTKLTPSQAGRAEIISEEIIKLSPIQFRVLFYLIQDIDNRNFNYKPYLNDIEDSVEDMWSQNYWASTHPVNLEFQKEISEMGLVGFHGFPEDFIEKLVAGNMFQDSGS